MSNNEVCSSRLSVLLNLLIVLLIPCTGTAALQKAPARKPKLSFAVILMRHGVRSPITSVEELNAFSSEPWPVWNVPSGGLTPQGRRSMTLFGTYYRDYFSSNGLLPLPVAKTLIIFTFAPTLMRGPEKRVVLWLWE
jgi:hypothetical protein